MRWLGYEGYVVLSMLPQKGEVAVEIVPQARLL